MIISNGLNMQHLSQCFKITQLPCNKDSFPTSQKVTVNTTYIYIYVALPEYKT